MPSKAGTLPKGNLARNSGVRLSVPKLKAGVEIERLLRLAAARIYGRSLLGLSLLAGCYTGEMRGGDEVYVRTFMTLGLLG